MLIIALLLAGSPCSIVAQEKNTADKVEAVVELQMQIAKARAARDETAASQRQRLLDALAKETELVRRQKGDAEERLKAIEALTAEQQAFEKDGTIPFSARMRPAVLVYLRNLQAAEAPVARAYDRAIEYCTKIGEDKIAAGCVVEKRTATAPRTLATWRFKGSKAKVATEWKLQSNGTVNDPDSYLTWSIDVEKLIISKQDPAAPKSNFVIKAKVALDGATFTFRNNGGANVVVTLVR